MPAKVGIEKRMHAKYADDSNALQCELPLIRTEGRISYSSDQNYPGQNQRQDERNQPPKTCSGRDLEKVIVQVSKPPPRPTSPTRRIVRPHKLQGPSSGCFVIMFQARLQNAPRPFRVSNANCCSGVSRSRKVRTTPVPRAIIASVIKDVLAHRRFENKNTNAVPTRKPAMEFRVWAASIVTNENTSSNKYHERLTLSRSRRQILATATALRAAAVVPRSFQFSMGNTPSKTVGWRLKG